MYSPPAGQSAYDAGQSYASPSQGTTMPDPAHYQNQDNQFKPNHG
jgi:hypothetical protein